MRLASRHPASEYIPRSSSVPVRARGWPGERVPRNRWRARAKRAENPPSHLFLAFDPRDHVGSGLALVTGEFPEHLPGGIQQDDGRKTFLVDSILLAEVFILLLQFGGLLLPLRIIDVHQDKIFRCVSGEFPTGKHALPHFDAWPAPVRAVKIEKHTFVLRLCLFECLLVIGSPLLGRKCTTR